MLNPHGCGDLFERLGAIVTTDHPVRRLLALGALVVAGTACAGAATVFWWRGYPLGLVLITAAGVLIGYRTARRSRKVSPEAKRYLP